MDETPTKEGATPLGTPTKEGAITPSSKYSSTKVGAYYTPRSRLIKTTTEIDKSNRRVLDAVSAKHNVSKSKLGVTGERPSLSLISKSVQRAIKKSVDDRIVKETASLKAEITRLEQDNKKSEDLHQSQLAEAAAAREALSESLKEQAAFYDALQAKNVGLNRELQDAALQHIEQQRLAAEEAKSKLREEENRRQALLREAESCYQEALRREINTYQADLRRLKEKCTGEVSDLSKRLASEHGLAEAVNEEVRRLRVQLAAKEASATPVAIDKEDKFKKAYNILVSGDTLPESSAAALLRDFITKRNAPENDLPEEYGGVGAKVQGLQVLEVAIGSVLQKGDTIVAASVDKNVDLPGEVKAFVKEGEIDFTAINKDPVLLARATALIMRGIPGAQVTLVLKRGEETVSQEVTRQLFGTDNEGKLIAFTSPDKIKPSEGMKELLNKIEAVERGPHTIVKKADSLSPRLAHISVGSDRTAG